MRIGKSRRGFTGLEWALIVYGVGAVGAFAVWVVVKLGRGTT